jgi:hypothetical protein
MQWSGNLKWYFRNPKTPILNARFLLQIFKLNSMLQEKIITYFQRNPNLKILFFFDAEGIHSYLC